MDTIFQHIQNLHNASGENGYNCAKHEHRLAPQKSGQKMSTHILQICTSTAGLSFFNSSHIIIHITTIHHHILCFISIFKFRSRDLNSQSNHIFSLNRNTTTANQRPANKMNDRWEERLGKTRKSPSPYNSLNHFSDQNL